MHIKSLMSVLVVGLIAASGVNAQNMHERHHDPHNVVQEAFLPFDTQPRSAYRTPGGAPAHNYWQNRADYEIDARLDTAAQELKASETITYTNNSPETLNRLWIQLDQNLFDRDSRGARITPHEGSRFGNQAFDGGYEIGKVTIRHGDQTYEPERKIVDTNMKLELREPLNSKGGQLSIDIEFSFKVPQYGSDRMGRLKTKNGWIYEFAQWYPRMAVYDDVKGWNVMPYLGAGEFYLEYGDFDVEITVPATHLVMNSGELLNREEVLTRTQIERLEEARDSDETVAIVGKEEVGTASSRPATDGMLTWHYRLENARDFAFGTSAAFIWDAARIVLPGGGHALAMSAYPIESSGESAWSRSTEYTKASIEFYSDYLFPYPYPKAVNIAGVVGGMEYPGVSFCSWRATRGGLWGVTNHEFGHNWFPMIVGSNERLHAWMDEGFNTFINALATRSFNDGEYQAGRTSARGIASFLRSSNNEAIMTWPDQIQRGNFGTVSYYKPAVGLHILRDVILGHERFDTAFKAYMHRWAYKHPTPEDFFNTIEDVAGEELDWYWRGWFKEDWKFDQAVDSVSYPGGDPSKGAVVSISNREKQVMPVTMRVAETNGDTTMVKLPVEVWHRGDTWREKINTTSRIVSVTLDPAQKLPDVNASNNVWRAADPGDQRNAAGTDE